MKFKLNRKKIEFEYEFMDGESAKFTYLEPTTEMIDEMAEVEFASSKNKLKVVKDVLKKTLIGDEKKIEKLIEEQTKEGNLYAFKEELDRELGKLTKKR